MSAARPGAGTPRRGIAIAMACGAVALAVAWFFVTFESFESERHLPARGEARYNPFFVLKLALQDLGREVEVRSMPAFERDRIAPGDLVVFGADVRTLTEPQVEKLLARVEAGTRVMVEVPRGFRGIGSAGEGDDAGFDQDAGAELENERDPALFDALEVYAGTPGSCLRWRPAASPEAASGCIARRLHFYGDEWPDGAWAVPAAAAGSGTAASADASDEEYADSAHAAIYLPHGAGAVLVASSLDSLRNTSLDQPSVAPYAWQLVAPMLGDGTVWLIYGADVPPLHVLLVRHGWPILAPALLALLAWLWARSARLGPPLPAAAPDRRALLEHVRAAGELAFRRGRALALHAALKRRYEARLRCTDPAIAALSGDDRIAALATHTGRAPADLRHALEPVDVNRPQSFHAAMKTLSELLHE